MKNKMPLLRWAGLCALMLIAFVSLVSAAQSAAGAKKAMKIGRADAVTLSNPVNFAGTKSEMPPVSFLHDQHTQALEGMGKDCSSCHAPAGKDGGGLSFVLKGTETVTAASWKDSFHTACVTCHVTLGAAGKKTGPVAADCRSCHKANPAEASNRQDIGFDKLLHYKHVASSAVKVTGNTEKNCAACHHVYDAEAKKLVWGKDKEDSCRACHQMPAQKIATLKADPAASDENGPLATRMTFDKAGHMACINCHLDVRAQKLPNVTSGPVNCAGCHAPGVQEKLRAEAAIPNVTASLPRLMRGQEDAVLLLAVANKDDVKNSMRPVSFNHKFHEGVVADCRSCHHKKIAACSSCHTLEGKKEGAFVTLSGAMHSPASKVSCVGCHNTAKQRPECLSCHATLPKNGLTKDSCLQCHTVPLGVSTQEAENGSLQKVSKERKTQLALETVSARSAQRATTYDLADIPDEVTIKGLSDEYEGVVLPHQKIVLNLMQKQSESRLAGVFHTDKATLCQSCHHHSPASKTPPKCASCHASGGAPMVAGLPVLKAAYHQQCMTCHATLKQRPAATECNDCHKPRKS